MKHLTQATSIVAILAALAACAPPAQEDAAPETEEAVVYPDPPSREGLAPGVEDAGEAIWNLELLHAADTPEAFTDPRALWAPAVEIALAQALEEGEEVERPPNPISFANTDIAFEGERIVMGNWHGFSVWNFNGSDAPENTFNVVCPGGQGDVSVWGDLVFRSVEDNRARIDCGTGGVEEESSPDRFLGVQIFDISDPAAPRQVGAVQTCRGSHTHTIVPDPQDENVIYIYNSATGGVRPDTELDICSDGEPEDNPDTARYSIDIIRVPLDAPGEAAIVNRPRIFADPETGEIAGLWPGGEMEGQERATSSTNHCHDITAYPAMGIAAGACSGNGIILDISDPANPVRTAELSDENMVYWHAAIFNNDADRVVFTDEWGGGLGARCRPEDPDRWGANVIADLDEDGLTARGYFKIPNTQTEFENCVAHNGGLVPVPGRDIMVQGWYSGGISLIDFTDPENPVEIGFFDRGPLDGEELYLGGNWAAYWHNGLIYAPEIVRGLDIFRLVPSAHLTENEIAAAELVRFERFNTQTQERFEWPDAPVVHHAYLDQLVRSGAVEAQLEADLRAAIDAGSGDNRLMQAIGAASQAASEADRERFHAIATYLN